jgi:large subunit ribosomal protein L25
LRSSVSVIDAVSIVDARELRPIPLRGVRWGRAPCRCPIEREPDERQRSVAVSEVRLSAEPRTEFGKGGARRTRRAGRIPAVIYGHGDKPRHVSLPAREFANVVRHSGANVLLTLELEGGEQLAIPKAIQRNAIKGDYEHVDLLAVRRGEKVTVDVPVHVVGDVVPGALLAQESTTVSIEADATQLPGAIEVSVEGLEIGTQVTAGDLRLPSGVTLVTDPSHAVLIIREAPTAEQMEGEIAEVAAELGAEEQPSAAEAPAEAAAESTPAEGAAE